VACPSMTSCIAVGASDGTSRPALAEQWNGTTWTIQPTPLPTGATLSQLLGVACTSAASCTAVGLSYDGTNYHTLAEYWNGTSWLIQQTLNPTGSHLSELYGLACTAVADCTAVGAFTAPASGIFKTLVEHWNGTAWSIRGTPNPAGSTGSQLSGVACTSSSSCMAVGDYFPAPTAADQTLAEQWNGTTWSILSTPNPSMQNVRLTGIACSAATACAAVGFGYGQTPGTLTTLAERWDGNTWTITPTPNVKNRSLEGVACTSASSCEAVGSSLAVRWDGSVWRLQATPNPPGVTAAFYAVACTSVFACTAVGEDASTAGTLAERYS
jgi:hypothetical protein